MDKELLSLVRDLKELLPLCFSDVMTDAEWEESKHPRDGDGKFSSGGGGGGSSPQKLTQSDVSNTAEENRERAEREGLGEVGKSSPNGEMKTVTLWHGSFADFDKFDYSKSQKRGSDLQGAGHYFTDDPEKASQFGDILYKVEVKYSTDRRTAKKTGREKDFQYDPETGYWVIPQDKEENIKILAKGKTEYQGAGHGVKVI